MNETIVAAYMGKNYEKATNKDPKKPLDTKVTVISALFGPILLFYYRCSLYGFICLIIQLIISSIIQSDFLPILLGCIYGYITYPIYNKVSRKKVEKLILKNPTLSEDELIALAAKKGKPNVFALILYILALILLTVHVLASASA